MDVRIFYFIRATPSSSSTTTTQKMQIIDSWNTQLGGKKPKNKWQGYLFTVKSHEILSTKETSRSGKKWPPTGEIPRHGKFRNSINMSESINCCEISCDYNKR